MKKVTMTCFFLMICQLLFPNASNNTQKNIDKRIYELKEEFAYELKQNNIESEIIASYELKEKEVILTAYSINYKSDYFVSEVHKLNNFNRIISKKMYFPQKKVKKNNMFFANLLGMFLALIFVGFVLKITYKSSKGTSNYFDDNKTKEKEAA